MNEYPGGPDAPDQGKRVGNVNRSVPAAVEQPWERKQHRKLTEPVHKSSLLHPPEVEESKRAFREGRLGVGVRPMDAVAILHALDRQRDSGCGSSLAVNSAGPGFRTTSTRWLKGSSTPTPPLCSGSGRDRVANLSENFTHHCKAVGLPGSLQILVCIRIYRIQEYSRWVPPFCSSFNPERTDSGDCSAHAPVTGGCRVNPAGIFCPGVTCTLGHPTLSTRSSAGNP